MTCNEESLLDVITIIILGLNMAFASAFYVLSKRNRRKKKRKG